MCEREGFCLFQIHGRCYHAGASGIRAKRKTWLGFGAPPGLPGSASGVFREFQAQRLTRRCSGPVSWRVRHKVTPAAELLR